MMPSSELKTQKVVAGDEPTLPMTSHFRIAIIGGGVAGCSLLYRLADKGCTDVVLLEKGELTSGSTWHAAGNLPLYMGGHTLTYIHKASLDFYRDFETRVNRDIGLHRCGSLKVATTEEEASDQKAYESVARKAGIAFEVVGPGEITDRFPYVSTDGVLSAAWTPDDGHVDPASLTTALADSAREMGAKVFRHRPVTGIERTTSGAWKLSTPQGPIVAEQVVNAAGLHAREVSNLVGHQVPVVPMERQYLVTEPLPDIGDLKRELPVLRDASAPLYARQEGQAMLLGLYDNEPVFWAVDGTPHDFDQTLLSPDLDRVGEALEKAMRRLPVLNDVGIKRVVNGPLLRTPDASPLIGPVPGIDNYWLNTGYFAGIAQAGGSAGILADWLLENDPGQDISAIAVGRFDKNVDAAYTMQMTRLAYAEELGRNVIDGTRTGASD